MLYPAPSMVTDYLSNMPTVNMGYTLKNIQEVLESQQTAGNNKYTEMCETWLEREHMVQRCMLTPSCTAALEMCAMLLDLPKGSEIILPSFTFVTTASAFALHGLVPVYVDVQASDLNIDPEKIEEAITTKTGAICVVHYAGVACNMQAIVEIANKHELPLIEDAAQCVLSSYGGKPLGSFGDLATLSFHQTKNISCGEGGALLINNPAYIDRAEMIREKGTNRRQFLEGRVQAYQWECLGSSFLMSDVTAAYLWSQLSFAHIVTKWRRRKWKYMMAAFAPLEAENILRLADISPEVEHNGHIFFFVLEDEKYRPLVQKRFVEAEIKSAFHYQPLHLSKGGAVGRAHGDLPNTIEAGKCLLRIDLDTEPKKVDEAVAIIREVVKQ